MPRPRPRRARRPPSDRSAARGHRRRWPARCRTAEARPWSRATTAQPTPSSRRNSFPTPTRAIRARAHASMLCLLRTLLLGPNGSPGGIGCPGGNTDTEPSVTWQMDPLILREDMRTSARWRCRSCPGGEKTPSAMVCSPIQSRSLAAPKGDRQGPAVCLGVPTGSVAILGRSGGRPPEAASAAGRGSCLSCDSRSPPEGYRQSAESRS